MKGHPQIPCVLAELVLGGGVGAGDQGPEARAGGEQAGGLAMHELHIIGLGDVDVADALELEKLAFDHHLGEGDQDVEHAEVALADGHLEYG